MPICSNCGKESNNVRTCPFCFVEYGPPKDATRGSTTARAVPAGAGGRAGKGTTLAGLSPAVRWGLPALIVVFGVWYFAFNGERKIPVGVVMPNMVVSPMSRGEAESVLRRLNATSTIAMRGGAMTVTFPKAIWPEHRDGQLALAQQYARADEIVSGSKRSILFHDPDGTPYAKASEAGVLMVR